MNPLQWSGCRFPGSASSPSKLWELLKQPRDLLSKIPKERFDVDAFYHPDGTHHGRTNARYAYLLDQDPYEFDASFFNLPANEVSTIDPQHRLMLETVYDGITTAGLKLEDLRGSSTAVYVGMMHRDFLDNQNYDLDAMNMYAATGTSASILSNRVSYFFDWHGPSMTIDTACSSSLVAVHHAIQQLRTGSSKVAIAAGAHLILGPFSLIVTSKLNMLSPTGRSRMWDAGADGYAKGEGVAAVVLKTLSQALKDGDSIECIIRESSINQDGRTPGITMPSHTAQEALIRDVYSRAGLDLTKPENRPQYFEAHGTGTAAGDPQEAQAISSAFFGERERGTDEEPLYVGSIKTIIGHTEGTAGIAGLMKASLAIQHGVIPPNMLFEKLSDQVAPFYRDLHVVTKNQSWPKLQYDQPRRVSVNSFGFGGTNAHIIVESSPTLRDTTITGSTPCLAPIALSANSESSLKAAIEDLADYLKTEPDTRIHDLVWTLLRNRSDHSVRYTTPSGSVAAVREALIHDAALIQGKQSIAIMSEARTRPQVLGIFTGQGAQWPAMGKVLLSTFAKAREIVLELDHSLQTLPQAFRPTWKLIDQLQLEGDDSMVHDATFSQPICCAIQILLTKLLFAAGIQFKVVVGHSSGEIACAYAAGFISSSQAVRIAYLRGLTSQLAKSSSGVEGAMMAVGTTFEDAQELCALETFEGRLKVAASNGPDSVTLSGDKDAILEAQEILNDESSFNRLLKVDKAYHSHHMAPCAEPYIAALKACGCDTSDLDIEPSATWISSVFEGRVMKPDDLRAEYWKDNLLSPVLFQDAVEQAIIKHNPIDVCLEVGAHPALKDPTLKTVENCGGFSLPYTGFMQRKKNDLDAFSAGLGYLWSHFGTPVLDLDRLYNELSIDTGTKSLSKDLPCYPWDHSRKHKKESRRLKAFLGAQKPHLLLGKVLAHSTPSMILWQNHIRQRDIKWLDGHSLQGQTVFPGAGYVVMAMEAALHEAGDREVQLLEVLNLVIDKAVTFEDENSLIELNLSLMVNTSEVTDTSISYTFVINSCLAKETSLSSSATGTIVVVFGQGSLETLPVAQTEPPHMNKVSVDRFYNMLDEIGYGYTKQFRGVSSLRRGDSKAWLVHLDIILDVAFQTFIGAYTSPGDKRLRNLLVPTGIDRIVLNPWATGQIHSLSRNANFVSTSTAGAGNGVAGDIEVFDPDTRATILQIEGLSFKPFSPPSAADDHQMFAKWTWSQLNPDAVLDDSRYHSSEKDKAATEMIERITYWYIKSFLNSLTTEDRGRAAFHQTKQIQWCEYIIAETKSGYNIWYDIAWEADTPDDIERFIRDWFYHPFIRLIQRVGENMLDVIRDNRNPFDLMDHDGLLTEFYGSTISYGHSYHYFQKLCAQINHRYQNMDVLEIGAGTGGASRYFLNSEQVSFNNYTFTDISNAFFEQAAKEFAEHADKMEFRPLDIRRDPVEQEYKPNSYDLVIASNVLHATPRLEETLANVRKLLKPGGQLVIIEVTHREHARIGFIFGLFADWWAGHDEGRVHEPFVTYEKWDELFRRTGFSGIVSRTLDPDSTIFPNGVFSTHAVNDLTKILDSPLTAPIKESYPPLVVIGGASSKTALLLEKLRSTVPQRSLLTVNRIRDVIDAGVEPRSTFIVLSELDEETFTGLDNDQFESLQAIFDRASHVLWVTESAWVNHPQQGMTIGLLRTLRLEYLNIQLQVLDVDYAESLTSEVLIETVQRLEDGSNWQENGILWTQEPELYLHKDQLVVARLKPDVAKNNRLNSNRRPVTASFDPCQDKLALVNEEGVDFFRCLEERHVPDTIADHLVRVQVTHSLAKAVRVGKLGIFNLIQGYITASGEAVVTLSESHASFIQASNDQLVRLESQQADATCVLPALLADLVAQTLLADAAPGTTVLVFDPPNYFIDSLVRHGVAAEVRLVIATVNPPVDGHNTQWIQLHPRETQRQLLKKIPANVSVFYNLATTEHIKELGRRLSANLPSSCHVAFLTSLIHGSAAPVSENCSRDALVALQGAVTRLGEVKVKDTKSTLTPSQLLSVEGASRFDSIIQCQAEPKITARVRSIETGRLFVDDKTYLLVGLSGDLGRSIARFMIEGGARHIVLSSRSPKIDPQWIEDMAAAGGSIMVLPMDVSNEASVDSGLATIRASMPPIAGVAFGPLVLQDVMFNNMDLSLMEMVLAPKVTGARLLNERLSDPSSPLDFFVMFSSFVMVSGNPGQAAYSAANAFTHALAQQRRSRGMAGSTIDIGAVYGVGFIARAGREEEYDVVRFMFDEVNEWELHALFAEAVVAGRAPGTDQVELVTGMPYVDPADRDQIPYFDDPRLAYYKLSDGRNKGHELVSAKGSVQERLLKAETMDEVRAIILEGVSAKIRGALQVAASDDLNLTSPLVDQGVDSLSAVTIGTWFSRNLSVDVPLLKILGGASVSDLVEESISRILPGAIPLAYDGSANEILKDEAPVAVEVEAMGLASNSGGYDDLSLPSDYINVPTPISLLSSPSDQKADGVERIAPLSIAQEYCWKQQQLGLDPSTFNSTIGMFMQGALDLNRLSWAFNQALQRHDAFRTSFVTNTADKSRPLQSVMKSPAVGFETIKVADRAAAERGFKDLERYEYNFSEGMTLKVVNYSWSFTDHLLVFAYHRLVGDGWTTEHLFVEAGQLYNGVQLDPPPSYADFAVRQRKDLVSGAAESDLSYWSTLFKTLPVRLPMLDVPGNGSRPHQLDQATMGFFASLLPVRLRYSPDDIFAEALIAVKDEIRAALLHSAVPYGAILEHLGLPNPSAADPESQALLFQAVFDYKQGQAETGSIGRANIVESRTSRAGSPYDIILEMSDDSNKDPLVILKLQSERYASGDAEVVMDAYLSILSIFSRNPALRVEDGRLDQGARAKP
ncbi:Hybrid PKS-NRPS [Pseudogymnoascus sp. 05NY08]|nr:Hybrid PKS-NRPS [Pseudogymnoascus sp. 05NY08]